VTSPEPNLPSATGEPSSATPPGRIAPRPRSAMLTVLLNTFLCGAGYLYLGQTWKGILVLLLVPVLAVFTIGIGVAFLVLFATIDGARLARRMDRGESIGKWQCF
jgi:TM2 domain-containing membrane protein YozV